MMLTIHEGRYDAAYTPDHTDGEGAMLVISYRDKGGTVLRGPLAAEWAGHIFAALDAGEANALCRAVYQRN